MFNTKYRFLDGLLYDIEEIKPNFIKITNLATLLNESGNPRSVICLEMVSLNSTTPKTQCLTPNIDFLGGLLYGI